MKKITLTTLSLLLTLLVTAQNNIGIGTNTPDSSAKLDIQATDKGILIPRIALIHTDSASPVSMPDTSLLVYNTDSVIITGADSMSSVYPGFYYWTGSEWTKMMDRKSDQTNTLELEAQNLKFRRETIQNSMSANSIFTFDVTESLSNITADPSTGKVTLEAGVTYHLQGSIGSTNSYRVRGSAQFYDETNSVWLGTTSNTIAAPDNADWSLNTGDADVMITPTTDIVVSFRIKKINATADFGHEYTDGQGGWPWISVLAIAGQLPVEIVNPLQYEYVEATSTGNSNVNLTTSWYTPAVSLTIPSDGVWDVISSVLLSSGVSNRVDFRLAINGNPISVLENDFLRYTDAGHTVNEETTLFNYTLSQGDVITMQLKESYGTAVIEESRVSSTLKAKKVAGQLPLVHSTVNDQSTSGYYDIGNTRVIWGYVPTTAGGGSPTTITFPVSFADGNYSLTATPDAAAISPGGDYSLSCTVRTKNTTSAVIEVYVSSNDPSDVGFSWQAIGKIN